MTPHSAERWVIQKTVIGNQADNSHARCNHAVFCKPNKLHVVVLEILCLRGLVQFWAALFVLLDEATDEVQSAIGIFAGIG